MKYSVPFLFIFLFGLNIVQATVVKPGNQRIETFVDKQGFFQNTVNAITSDENGYLWFSTPNGLVRYDGYSFRYFYHDSENPESIPYNYINNLLKGFDGKLWIGTGEGLCLYIAEKEQFIPLKYKIQNETFIKEDPLKRIWVGKDTCLYVFESTNSQHEPVRKIGEIDLGDELEEKLIVDIEFLSATELIVTTDSKLYKITILDTDNLSFEISPLNTEYDFKIISKIIKKENTIWIGTSYGLHKTFLENNDLTVIKTFFDFRADEANQQIAVLSMFIDSECNLWIGTVRNGVLKYDNKARHFIAYKFDAKNESGLTSNRINCFYEDDFGVMWIGTAQGGLNKLDNNQKSFNNYTHNPYDNSSLSSNLITNITEAQDGRIWLSFYYNTICRTLNKPVLTEGSIIKFERLQRQLGELDNKGVLRIFQDRKGYWWIGAETGIYVYDEKQDKLRHVCFKQDEEEVPVTRNRVISQIDAEHMLIGGASIILLNNPWEAILKEQPVIVDSNMLVLEERNAITGFVQDEFGHFWFGSRKGVLRLKYTEGKWKLLTQFSTFTEQDSFRISHNIIFSIHKTWNKDIWVGTFGGGLIKIKLNSDGEPEKIKEYHKKDGLPDEAIYGILEDDEGKFWISTDMGICRFDPITDKFDVYDVNDGLINNNFRQSSSLKTKSGIMLMGGLNGLTIFDPKQITKNKILPKVLITRLIINDKPIVAGEKVDNKVILEHAISDTKKLVLNHQNRNISLDIIVQHSSAPKKNRLSYMLAGVNKNWIEVDEGKTTATYTNLNPGTYKFLYKGTNGDGIGTEKISELEIKVLAPWYERWYSLITWAILVLLLAFGVFRYLVSLEKLKQKLNFEQMDKERIHEIDQAKLRFFTNISHEFKTPLSLIIGPLEKISELNRNREAQKYSSIIRNNISRLQRLIDQLISYRKAETGYLELKHSKITLGNFIYPLLEAFEENAKNKNINFYYKVYSPNREVIIDIDKTEQILLNLISNALKFSDSNGDVSVEAGFKDGQDKEMLFIEVTDTGIGIPPEKIDNIFDRFYRAVDDRASWSGTGIGLALCKSLLDLMKGTIAVKSIPGKKTSFVISLPFDNKLDVEVYVEKTGRSNFVTDWIPTEYEEIQNKSIDNNLPSLLIIDDEPDVRSFLQEAFQNQYKITLAVDGKDGLKKIKENTPQLVISDVMMPKLDGYQLCKKIKSNPETCHIPVILLTALNNDDKRIEGLELGADDYISKPFSIKHLEVRVKTLIENKQRIIEFFSSSSLIPEEDLSMTEKDRNFLEKIITSIEKNISDSGFGVVELAKDAGMSTSHLYRRLKQLTGQVPNVYVRNLRLQKAADLLKSNKDLNANEVMCEIGMESPSYFSTSFKKLHGVSPSEFIKKRND